MNSGKKFGGISQRLPKEAVRVPMIETCEAILWVLRTGAGSAQKIVKNLRWFPAPQPTG